MPDKPSRTIGRPEHHSVVARTPSGGALLEEGNDGGLPTLIVRYLDVVFVALGVPTALALGAPTFGCLVGAVAWLAQRVLAEADKRWVSRAAEPRTRLGLTLFEAFGRIWLLAGAIIIAGVGGGRHDGLAAALVIFGAYSVAFAVRLLSGRPTAPRAREVPR